MLHSPEKIKKLLTHKDEDVKKLAEFVNEILYSPYYESYSAMLFNIKSWNKQITEGGAIDLLSDKDDKSYDRTMKFFLEGKYLHEQLDYYRSKMLPEDIKKVEKDTTSEVDRQILRIHNESRAADNN